MPQQFRGSVVRLERVAIQGSPTGAGLKFTIQFTDREGIVYATSTHEVEVGVTPRVHAAITELRDAITEWATKVHFQDATPAESKKVLRGIAESLHNGDASADDLEEQG